MVRRIESEMAVAMAEPARAAGLAAQLVFAALPLLRR
jgi:hypothetical protein